MTGNCFLQAPLYDLNTGVTRLQLTRVSRASADQRTGRAGRTSPGTCYRLYDSQDIVEESTPPEIHGADLAPLVLELAAWGCPDGVGLPWCVHIQSFGSFFARKRVLHHTRHPVPSTTGISSLIALCSSIKL